jgi:hypothetical protein
VRKATCGIQYETRLIPASTVDLPARLSDDLAVSSAVFVDDVAHSLYGLLELPLPNLWVFRVLLHTSRTILSEHIVRVEQRLLSRARTFS